MKKQKKTHKFIGLRGKMVNAMILLGIFLCIVTCINGYYRFTAVLERQYNTMAYHIADTALSYIDGDKLDEYLSTQSEDEAYRETQKKLDSLAVTTDATLIYVAKVDPSDYRTLTYVFDSVHPDSGFSRFELGFTESDIDENYIDAVEKLMTTGERSEQYYYSNTLSSGSHTTAAVAVYDSSGKITGMLGVEKAMTELGKARRRYVLGVVFGTILSVTIFIMLYTKYLNRSMILPVLTIAKEARKFTENGAQLSNKLTGIVTTDEIGVLAQSVYKMQVDIKRYIENLTKVTAERERIGAELNVATQIQEDMLPRIFPYMPERLEFDLYATMAPAREVGGDFYDYFMVDNDHLAIVIGDVSGKGIPAALFMVISKTLIKNYTMLKLSPEEAFIRTNNDLCEGNEASLFTTAWMGVYELSTGILKFTEAGHDTPIRRKIDGTIEYVNPSAKRMMLAAMEETQYVLSETTLKPGELLFIYTDGVPEATNSDNKLFGQNRLEESMVKHAGDNPKELLVHIREDVNAFVGDAPQFDDLTMLALEIVKYEDVGENAEEEGGE